MRYFLAPPHGVLHRCTRTAALPARRGHLHRADRSPRPPLPRYPIATAASTKPASLLVAVGVWLLAGVTVDRANPAAAVAQALGHRVWSGLGQAQAQLAAPPSLAAGWPEPGVPRSTLRCTDEEW
jgi:hypothetical protein